MARLVSLVPREVVRPLVRLVEVADLAVQELLPTTLLVVPELGLHIFLL